MFCEHDKLQMKHGTSGTFGESARTIIGNIELECSKKARATGLEPIT